MGVAGLALWMCAAPASGLAATILVTPADDLAKVLREAGDGDRIDIAAGEYRGQVGVIQQKNLTLRGIGGRPVFKADGRSAEGKAILVVRNGQVRIENIEFRGARVPDGNGAGIRFEHGQLTVVRCAFFDNQNGILTANFSDAELTVQDSEFGQAPRDATLPHLLYVGRIARFTLSGSRFGGGTNGHLVKSRARESIVRYNQLVDGVGGQAAYELEFPNGGRAWVIGNVIGQSATTSNPVVMSFGAEGTDDRPQGLFVVNNTFINEGLKPALFLRVHDLGKPVERVVANNLYVGLGVSDVAWADVLRGNYLAPPQVLQDPEVGQYGLGLDSLLRHRGVDPAGLQGTVQGQSLRPDAEFTPPAGTRPLSPRSRWSPGAYQ
jgi:hypothetical protein